MQKIKRIILLALTALTLTQSAEAQTAYKGQLYINNERFTLQGELLRVQLRISYDDDILNSGETLNITPVLKDGQHVKELSSVVVRGKERGKYEDRNDFFDNRLRSNIAVVTADKKHGTRYFIYDTTVPFSKWMAKASLYIESEERDWGKKAHLYEDKIYERMDIVKMAGSTDDCHIHGNYSAGTAARMEWLQFLNPTESENKAMEVTGTIPLADSRKIGKMSEKKFNKAVLEDVLKTIDNELQIPGTAVTSLQITGYGSPCGNYKSNESKAASRAFSLKKYLMANRVVGADQLTVTWVAEDWDSIATIIGKSQMKLKAASLDIINTVPIVKGREDDLRELGDGAPYSFMKHYIFPEVERIRYTVSLKRTEENVISTVNNDKKNMSLNSMFATAQSFKVGSREFNDIIDLMARLFPDNAEANINAAGVSLMRGDTAKAEEYLKPWTTDSRAYNNLGILHLLNGDLAKAEVYLVMAEAAGVSQSSLVLDYLRNIKK